MILRSARQHSTGLAALVALAFVAVLGNMRPAASETTTVDSTLAKASVGSGVPPDAEKVSDEVSLVPAIYAWDPDVRFMYFRHVSKWM